MEKCWFIVRGGDKAQEGPFEVQKLRDMAANGQLKKSDGLRNKNNGHFIRAGDFWGFLTGTNSSATELINAHRADTSELTIALEDDLDEFVLGDCEEFSLEPSKPDHAEPQHRTDRQSNQQVNTNPKTSGLEPDWWNASIPNGLGIVAVAFLFLSCYLGYRWLYSPEVTPPQTAQSSSNVASGKDLSIPIPIASDPTQQLANLSNKIEQWKGTSDKLAKVLSTLEIDKKKIVDSLRKMGASAKDIKSSDPKTATLLVELQDILRQIVSFDKKRNEYDLAIFKSESRLRILERRIAAQDLVGTDEELSSLISSIAEIDQELDSETGNEIPIELDELIINSLNDSNSSESDSVLQKR